MTEAITALLADNDAGAGGDAGSGKDGAAAVADKGIGDGAGVGDGADKGGKAADEGQPDWRKEAAGDNEDYQKLLARYSSVKGVVKALHDTKTAISQGKFQKARPEDGDEKAMAEWRKEQGIPDAPEGYKLSEVVTKAMTDVDKPVLASFTEFAHKRGANQDAVNIATEWYFDQQAAQAEAQAETDKGHAEEATDAMRKDWGAEFKGNLNLAKRFLDESPIGAMGWAGLRNEQTGRLLGSDPAFMQWATDQGRQMFGDAVFANSDLERKHDDRRKEIEGVLKTDRARYFRDGLDKEYAEILSKEEKRQSKRENR